MPRVNARKSRSSGLEKSSKIQTWLDSNYPKDPMVPTYIFMGLLGLVSIHYFQAQLKFQAMQFILAAVFVYFWRDLLNWSGRFKYVLSWSAISISIFLACISLVSFPNFLKIFGVTGFSLQSAYWLWILSLIVLVFLVKHAPFKVPSKGSADWPLPFSIGILFLILTVAFWLRFYHSETPGGYYWDDWAVEAEDPLNIVDFHNFPIIFPVGKREPFFSYFMAGIYFLLPHASMLLVQRLTCVLIDLMTIGFMYLLGTELRSRRTGLILAALGAISLPMMIKCITGMRIISLPLGVVLVLWTFIRLIREPSIGRFVQWGLALGFGTYTYAGFRIWIFFLIFCSWIWLIWKRNDKTFTKWLLFLIGVEVLLTLDMFLVANGYLTSSTIFRVVSSLPALIVLGMLLVLGIWMNWKDPVHGGKNKGWIGSGIGVLIAVVAAYPILMQPDIIARMKVLTIFNNPTYNQLSLTSVSNLWAKFIDSMRFTFFTWAGDIERSDLGIRGNSLFDFWTLIPFFIGLGWLFSRVAMRNLFWVLSILVGMTPQVLSFDPHSGKLFGCIVPVLVVAALGMDEFLTLTFDLIGRVGGMCLMGAFLFFLFWGGRSNFTECHDWASKPQYPNSIVADQATRDAATYQVFITYGSEFASAPSQDVLEEKNHVRLIRESNPIHLLPNEAGKDLSILISGSDSSLQKKIKKEFPKASWSFFRADWQGSDRPPLLARAMIPIHELNENPKKLFYVQRLQPISWVREFYSSGAGIARGVIVAEDSDPLLTTLPSGLGGNISARLKGNFNATKEGSYQFSVITQQYMIVLIDGQKVLDVRPRPIGITLTQTKSVFLKSGNHSAEILVAYQVGREPSKVQVVPPGSKSPMTLGL